MCYHQGAAYYCCRAQLNTAVVWEPQTLCPTKHTLSACHQCVPRLQSPGWPHLLVYAQCPTLLAACLPSLAASHRLAVQDQIALPCSWHQTVHDLLLLLWCGTLHNSRKHNFQDVDLAPARLTAIMLVSEAATVQGMVYMCSWCLEVQNNYCIVLIGACALSLLVGDVTTGLCSTCYGGPRRLLLTTRHCSKLMRCFRLLVHQQQIQEPMMEQLLQ